MRTPRRGRHLLLHLNELIDPLVAGALGVDVPLPQDAVHAVLVADVCGDLAGNVLRVKLLLLTQGTGIVGTLGTLGLASTLGVVPSMVDGRGGTQHGRW